MKVLHSHPVWLPQTQTWMHSLVQSLPPRIENAVSCLKTMNLDQFPVDSICCFADDAPVRRTLHGIANRLNFLHRFPLKFEYLPAHIDRFGPDIVHTHFGHNGARDSELLKSYPNVKHVVTFYGMDVTRLPQSQPSIVADYRRMFSRVACVLCEGEHMARNVEKLGCPADRIVVQHLGVDVDKFPFVARQWNPNEKLRVFFAAAFREKKGIPYALAALARLAADVPMEITIVGDAADDPASRREKERIMEVVEEHHLDPLIRWEGLQSHRRMLELAYDHHLFVSTSVHASDGDTEGGAPVSLIEMASTGMPIISSKHCDIPSVVLDEKTGWLAEERDVDSIVDKLRRAVSLHEQWPSIGLAGRQHIEAEYSLQKQGKSLAQIYDQIVRGGCPGRLALDTK
ncbi:D-inositol-3-phosphate glycosyltransferase [Planctomycetes bacterium CA13]|uniref:D-inositol-3-phosphate glycosyltransferase n=1 Tax=Novipirellula herctigrandis TaxID=2527986 RepID=A0A5C5YWP5_9BACT|nr:D-inositol-3-phosphate glycosyltransferase [Planctomycetes bacterium CA13]